MTIETSYAKRVSSPQYQMADGLRTVCNEMIEHSDLWRKQLILTAYVMDDSRGTNDSSIHVLEACGFEERSKIRYDEDAQAKDRLFILNPNKLREHLAKAVIS